jgi:hypothetical protein
LSLIIRYSMYDIRLLARYSIFGFPPLETHNFMGVPLEHYAGLSRRTGRPLPPLLIPPGDYRMSPCTRPFVLRARTKSESRSRGLGVRS